ncbi:pirin family protein [Brachybacterium saurashtrense]|uniref:Pirin family protein n=1 Tax=Brachybacterium saurashtrense TaxID=556288 RepID=A0A345YPA9_9MICO|nr:pirin family protein [Brachybacterium saurashtrense]AXK45761.1 pirin family protein [Brachybacterium saurashtrense]RRR24779.1 pirin family protein [Brachybacterium saurashtrense]
MTTFEDFVPLAPREVPLGGPRGMTVHRTLPARRTSLIGAWCFVDHFGPDDVSATDGMRVARHPHTGLATVSWLFEGAITHRDSLGSHALVRPGDVDLMVAGAGITHSEFSTLDTTVLHGVQLWYALPDRARFRDREFSVHTPAEVATGTARARVGLGTLHAVDGEGDLLEDHSPVVTDTALGMAQLEVRAGSTLRLHLDPGHEHGLLVDRGTAGLRAGERACEVSPRELVVLPDGADHLEITVTDEEDLRAVLLGGEPLGEDIVMWWNFVGRTHEEIAAFRARYQAEIGAEPALAQAPIAEVVRERGGLAEDAEQFGPFAPHTPAALPAPALPHGRLRPRGRRGLPA